VVASIADRIIPLYGNMGGSPGRVMQRGPTGLLPQARAARADQDFDAAVEGNGLPSARQIDQLVPASDAAGTLYERQDQAKVGAAEPHYHAPSGREGALPRAPRPSS
jgi:hypothetical protein